MTGHNHNKYTVKVLWPAQREENNMTLSRKLKGTHHLWCYSHDKLLFIFSLEMISPVICGKTAKRCKMSSSDIKNVWLWPFVRTHEKLNQSTFCPRRSASPGRWGDWVSPAACWTGNTNRPTVTMEELHHNNPQCYTWPTKLICNVQAWSMSRINCFLMLKLFSFSVPNINYDKMYWHDPDLLKTQVSTVLNCEIWNDVTVQSALSHNVRLNSKGKHRCSNVMMHPCGCGSLL